MIRCRPNFTADYLQPGKADFSKGVVGQFFKSLGETSQLPSFFWLFWIFQWMLCRRLKRHVFVCEGHSRNFFFLSNSNETVKGYFKAGFLFLSHIGHVPFVEHVGSVQLLSKNKTARDILTQEVFVFLVRFVHTCISIFCHLCLLLLCLWSHVIHVAQPKMTDWHLEGLAFCTFLSTTSAVHRFSSKF